MSEKSKLELRMEATLKKIEKEQAKFKELKNEHKENERSKRNHRLCKRHGYIESVLPESLQLTDEQFETFVKQHIANQHGRRALAALLEQTAKNTTPATEEVKAQNNGDNTPETKAQNSGTPVNNPGETA